MHGFITLSDATSYDKNKYKIRDLLVMYTTKPAVTVIIEKKIVS